MMEDAGVLGRGRDKLGSAGGKGTASRKKKAPAPLKNLARTTRAGYIRPLGRKFWPAPDISGQGPEISGLGEIGRAHV